MRPLFLAWLTLALLLLVLGQLSHVAERTEVSESGQRARVTAPHGQAH
jgi:hypothetical protein